uniref:DUF4604 domain-containing protein n=1 Tax=Parastrongyloides trichosuri TaxID=131310 RepID=A0A0N4ZNE6_PARTI
MSKKSSLNYQQRQNLKYVSHEDPPFIQEMKKKMGYQEVTINDKFHSEDGNKDNEEEKDDFKPQVVVLDPKKDLSQEEVEKEIKKMEDLEDKKSVEEGKIIFKKRKKKNDDSKDDTKRRKDELESKKNKPVNTCLLSFVNDDEEY